MHFPKISLSRPLLVLFLFAAVMVSVTGCKREGCTDPASINYDPEAKTDDGSCQYPTVGELHLHFHSMLGSSAFQFGTEVSDPQGRKIKFDVARFYISNVRLMHDGGTTALPDEYLHVNASTAEYHMEDVPSGHYLGIMFDVGVDHDANTSDPSAWPAGHALSSASATFDHWSWNTGYLFIRLEGAVDTTAAMSGSATIPFEYHVGLDRSRREVSINQHFEVAYDAEATVHLEVDWLKFVETLDLTQDLTTHTMDDSLTAATIANQASVAITAEQ